MIVGVALVLAGVLSERAGALALVFTPFHEWIEARVRRPNLAAAFSLVIVGLLVVAPATWFAQKLAEQAILVPQKIQQQIAAGKWQVRGDAAKFGMLQDRFGVGWMVSVAHKPEGKA